MKVRASILAVLFLAALGGGAWGCGGGEDRATTVEPRTPTSQPTAEQRLTATAEPGSTLTPERRTVFSEAELSEALLELDDMPTGWTVSSPEEEEGDDDFCGKAWESSALSEVEANYQQSEMGPFVMHAVQSFRAGEAQKEMAEILAKVESCSGWTDTDDDGTEITWTVAPLSFPKIGDDTLAFRVSSDATLFGFASVDFVFVRHGDLLALVLHFAIGFDGIDSEQTETFVRRADEKLAALK